VGAYSAFARQTVALTAKLTAKPSR
jgi:hypothetical protein